MVSTNVIKKARARAKKRAAREEAANEAAEEKEKEEERRLQEELSKMSAFARLERLEPPTPFVARSLSAEDRQNGVYVGFDFENGSSDFPPNYDMRNFRKHLRAAISKLLNNKKVKVLGIYGAGALNVLLEAKVQNIGFMQPIKGYQIEEPTEYRYSKCSCGRKATHGDSKIEWTYERVTDWACDKISEELSFYPISVGHIQGQPCHILLISLDKDFRSTVRKLSDRGVNMMLAYPGDDDVVPSAKNLLGSFSQQNVMKFRSVFPK